MISHRPASGRVKRRLGASGALRTVLLAGAALAATSAFAWKPLTHIYAAQIATEPIMAGNNYVTVNGENYAVDSRVADAIRAFPSFYRAGVCGPDLYPDMYVGQAVIHPDNHTDNGSNLPGEFGPGHSFTYEWFRHVFEAGWDYYNNSGDSLSERQKILAFSYGYLTHGAGDMWAHTFVNEFARGSFPAWTDVPNLGIGIRHIVIESGYIGKHTPVSDTTLPNGDGTLSAFIYNTLIAGGKEGGFVDSANHDTWSLGRGVIFGFFFDLRWAVYDRLVALEGLGILNPIYILTLPLQAYMDAWVDDIDAGLVAWPDMSQEIGHHLVGTKPENFEGAGDAIQQFIFDHLISMIGFPDFVAEIMEVISDIMSAFADLIEPLANEFEKLRNWLILQLTGFDIEEFKDWLFNPANHINEPLIGLGPGTETSDALDALMGRTPGTDEKFDPNEFKAFKNTVTTSALVLMTPEALNQLLYDLRVGPLYQSGSLFSDRDNFMLGFIGSIDTHQQWRRFSEVSYPNSPTGTPMGNGMPIWNDCLARDRVFRVLFETWPGEDFGDHGDLGEDIAATPPPTSQVAVLGAQYASGGVTYVGNASTFQVSAPADHFWNLDEIEVSGAIVPDSPTSGDNPIVLGPIVGADGVYEIQHNALGECLSGPPHAETTKSSFFTLDATPPTVTITSPADGLILDVIHTTTLDFGATDSGSGVKAGSEYATLDGVPILDGATIDAFYLDAGVHTILATAEDNIGNVGETEITIEVRATIAGLKAALTRAYVEKLVTIPTKDKSMQTKLDSAQKNFNANKIGTCKNNLSSLAEQVTQNVGSGIDPYFGARFVGWINDLINRL